jgi:Cu-Zn family superoxide dismutase
MRRSTMTTPAAATLLVLVLPAAALAGAIAVDHGHGPTYVHDGTYADVVTQVHSWASDGHTEIRLMVDGLEAGRRFGAHVHLKPCGSLATDSGGHYQHGDVALPLSDREIWLDFTTDVLGHGVGRATVPWLIEAGTAGSVVVHASPTDPVSGAAGARLFCTTVPFGQ